MFQENSNASRQSDRKKPPYAFALRFSMRTMMIFVTVLAAFLSYVGSYFARRNSAAQTPLPWVQLAPNELSAMEKGRCVVIFMADFDLYGNRSTWPRSFDNPTIRLAVWDNSCKVYYVDFHDEKTYYRIISKVPPLRRHDWRFIIFDDGEYEQSITVTPTTTYEQMAALIRG